MADCKKTISLANLDTIIFLLRQVLEACPVRHPLHHDIMCNLASALGMRFLHTNEPSDFEESEALRKQIAVTIPTVSL